MGIIEDIFNLKIDESSSKGEQKEEEEEVVDLSELSSIGRLQQATDLPKYIHEEIQYRFDFQQRSPNNAYPPPKKNIIKAFKSHYARGLFDPRLEEKGALQILEELGGIPKSTDHLVKNADANCVDQSKAEMKAQRKRHRVRLRLMRCGEFVKSIKVTNGDIIEKIKDCHFFQVDNADTNDYGEDVEYDGKVDRLEEDEIIPIAEAFTLGFYIYCNKDQTHMPIYTGHRIENLYDTQENHVEVYIQEAVSSLMHECEDLSDRYINEKMPLGKAVQEEARKKNKKKKGNNKKGKNNKKKGRSNTGTGTTPLHSKKTHAQMVEHHMDHLLKVLISTMKRPSIDYTFFLSRLLSMLSIAIQIDHDVTRCLCGGKVGANLLQLRQMSLQFAKNIDEVALMPKVFADEWWSVTEAISILVGHTLEVAVTEMGENQAAINFCNKFLLPDMINNLQSDSTGENYEGLRVLSLVLEHVPENTALRFITNKDIWNVIQSICTRDLNTFSNLKNWSGKRIKARELYFFPKAAREALKIIINVCDRGINMEKMKGNALTPEPLAFTAIQQGAVDTFMTCARSKVENLGMHAIEGLGQISRIEACRRILFKRDDTIDLIRNMLTSNVADYAAATMLLTVHLLWDDDFRVKIMKIDPPIESICLKWATFGLFLYCVRAEELKSIYDKAMEQIKNGNGKQKKPQHWLDSLYMEEQQMAEHPTRKCISRSLLLMSTIVPRSNPPTRNGLTNILDRLVKARAFHLSPIFLDSSMVDMHTASLGLLSSTLVLYQQCNFRRAPEPSMFSDPDQMVESLAHLEELFKEQNHMATKQQTNLNKRTVTQMFMLLATDYDFKWNSILNRSIPPSLKCMMPPIM